MVTRTCIMACLIVMAAAPVWAVPAYQIDRKAIALGEAATLTLTVRPGMADKLDLAPLARSFEILNRNIGRDKNSETLTLTLYPLQIGRLDLAIPGLRGRAPLLEVSDGSKDTPQVRYRIETEPATYHARQPVRLTLEACDSSGLRWKRPPLPTREGLFLRPLGEDQQATESAGLRCTAQRWHWAMTATAAGDATLPLPMLEATHLGRRLRFPPPAVRLAALPVPAWLPAEAAVGKPTVIAKPLASEWPIERPLAWRIEVTGGYTADALKNLLALQLVTQPLLNAYPPTVEALPGDSATPHHAITLTLLPRERGAVSLPELTFPWIDPASNQLEQVRLPGASLQIVDPAWQRLLAVIGSLIALATASALAYLAYRTLGWRWQRRVTSADFLRATDIADLTRRVRGFSLRGGVSPAPTLGAWQQRMERETMTAGLAPLVTALEAARYGETAVDLAQLRQQARACLRTARPRKRKS